MNNPSFIIFDVDDTLLDFGRAFYLAQQAMAGLLGQEYSPEYCRRAEECGYRAWRESGMENTADPNVQRHYHKYYLDYVTRQCEYLAACFNPSADFCRLRECYLESISSSCIPMEEDTFALLEQLRGSYRLVLATNGLERIQRPRTAALEPFVHEVFISESVGAIKPSPDFFRHMLDRLGCKGEDCLMVGDSLSNDILGAKVAGLRTCWYNIKNKPAPEDCAADYIITAIGQLTGLLL